jgi:excinuclease ABC subunit C
LAPCVGRVTVEEHRDIAKKFAGFRAGKDADFISELQERMRVASDSQNYELAAKLRDQVVALETVLAKSAVVFTDQTDADMFGIADDELAAAVSLFRVRGGRIRGVRGWVIDKELDRTPAEIVEYALQHTYMTGSADDIPKQVLVSELPDDQPALAQWLSELRGSKVSLRMPQRGDMAALAQTANANAEHALALYKTKRSTDFTARSEALAAIQSALSLDEPPLRIECIDVSHLQGTDVVASMVVFEDGLPKKAHYRRFNIESTTDDTDSIYQVLMRRLRYLVNPVDDSESDPSKFAYRPSLIIVDGGQPQVNAAKRAIDDSGISGLTVVGIAKRLEEIWLPNNPYPVIFARASDEMFLMQRIRDEAHRFAISFQRSKRKSTLASSLDVVPGLGEKKVRALLSHFGSAKRVRLATVDELADVPGISKSLASTIHATLTALEQKIT